VLVESANLDGDAYGLTSTGGRKELSDPREMRVQVVHRIEYAVDGLLFLES
jgi:hypothetical protein